MIKSFVSLFNEYIKMFFCFSTLFWCAVLWFCYWYIIPVEYSSPIIYRLIIIENDRTNILQLIQWPKGWHHCSFPCIPWQWLCVNGVGRQTTNNNYVPLSIGSEKTYKGLTKPFAAWNFRIMFEILPSPLILFTIREDNVVSRFTVCTFQDGIGMYRLTISQQLRFRSCLTVLGCYDIQILYELPFGSNHTHLIDRGPDIHVTF